MAPSRVCCAVMIDLHTHSSASDGEVGPAELIDLAASQGLLALALTDHDTLSGLEEARKRAEQTGIRLIPGVETEVRFQPGEFHLLGLGLKNYADGALADFLREIRRRRDERNAEMLHLMRADGLPISAEELNKLAEGEVLGRMHFARWLIDHHHAANVPVAFERWLGPGRPYHVPKNRPEIDEAVDAIHAAGGKAILAHPLSLWISWGRLDTYLPEWKERGLDGVESRHSGASRREAARLDDLATRHGLLISGGSDYHGAGRPDRRLGYGAAGVPVDDDLQTPFVDG